MSSEAITAGDVHWIHLAEEVEAVACADFYRAAPAEFGFSVKSTAGATLFLAPRVPVGFFNRVVGFSEGMSMTEEDLDRVIGVFEAANVPGFWMQITPKAAPPDLPAWLAARGFTLAPRPSWAKFVRKAGNPLAWRSELELRPADASDGPTIARIITDAYGLPSDLGPWIASLVGRPDWLFFVACQRRTPVATGALHVQRDSAWLGLAATDAQHRGLGAQSALLALRIEAAGQRGCRTVVTETGEPKENEPNPSLANIRRAGFVQVCSRLNYRRLKA